MNLPPKVSRYAWIVVGLLWIVALLNYLDRLMITSMRDPIKDSIPMTDAQFGLLTTIFNFVYGGLSPFGGYLADRFNRRSVIMASLLVWSAVTWLTGHVHSFEMLLTARAIMGISEACYIPAALALISDFHRGSTRSLATGLHMSGIYAGAALGGVGGLIAEHYGWRLGFTLFGAIGVGYSLLLIFSLKDAPRSEAIAEAATEDPRGHDLFGALAQLLRLRGFWLLLALNSLVGTANWVLYGWLPTYLKEEFSLSLGSAGMSATAYIQVASFAGVLVGGVWADRWSRHNLRGRALVPAIGYCIAGPFLFLAASTPLLAVAIGGLIVYGLGRGFYDSNLMPVLRQVIPPRYSATGYGLLNTSASFAGGAMVYIGGYLKDHDVNLSRVFQASAIGIFLVGLMLFALRPKPQTD